MLPIVLYSLVDQTIVVSVIGNDIRGQWCASTIQTVLRLKRCVG